MAGFEDLRDVDPNAYAEEARNWQTAADGIRDRGTDLEQQIAKLTTWQGASADAAKAKLSGYRKQYADAAAVMAQIPPVLNDAAARLGRAHSEAWRLLDEARTQGWTFDPAGKVVSASSPPAPMASLDPEAQRLQDAMRAQIDEFTHADADTANALRRLTAQSAGLAPPDQATTTAAATAIPPRTSAPADVKRWWDSLSPMQQESLLFTHAGEIGALDGLPATVRDRANRTRLTELQSHLEAEKQRLDAKGGQLSQEERDRLADINAKLKGLNDIAGRLHTPTGTNQQAFLLGVDTAGTGRAIVAMGNPDTSANLCTYVPGTGAKLADVKREMDRSDAMAIAAGKAGSPSTSTIAWVGYDAPQNVATDSWKESYANRAQQDLDRFQDGLRVTHEGARSHNAVLGHSYGTTVIGLTAHNQHLDADDVIFLGSPGLGFEVGKASDLNLPPDHVWASTAQNDMIRNTNDPESYNDPTNQAMDILGRDPADPRFGGRVFTSAPGTPGTGVGIGSEAAHSEYWNPNNISLSNVGKIIAGRPAD